jgi:hypothetical protein
MALFSGVWYSHYAGIGRLDGYRAGKWGAFAELVVNSGKNALFPNADDPPRLFLSSSPAPLATDYFVMYDDTVYGQGENDLGGNGGWDLFITRYMGVVRAINIFNGDPNRGSVIVEYFNGCAPSWDYDIRYGQRPFFGIYYRVLGANTIQMANAVDLAALYAKRKYYTETATLREAIEKNTVENEAEFISWGVVIPQDRENK